ncbi:hypothetical protein QQS21_008658 [Conoideocrella luteorostrata]|uniref:Polyketide synthase n=1 Tax=Conoideocrella luteorostrata TaxID=1105319 RepID=A0AAJ0FVT3_9HYPO|nr:hypothetical protein QQS21_008658 [Conoideocrella luteorostrata]
MGVCTGSLAAIAAVAANSDSDLLQLAPHFVQLSLRLGVEVSRRSLSLDTSSGSWSTCVSGLTLDAIEDELQKFNDRMNPPKVKQVYISGHSASSVTVSGPPTLLEAFLSQGTLRNARTLPLPIYGAFHAKHLPLPDLDSLIGTSPVFDRPVPDSRSLLHLDMPTSTRVRDTLRLALSEMFQHRLNLDRIIEQACQRTSGHGVRLTSIGPAMMRRLIQQLEPKEVCRQVSDQSKPSQGILPSVESGESIAVVGMAGRFPGAENVDELWDMLVKGQDVHKMIPIDRFDVKSHVDTTGKVSNTSLTPYGCFYDGVSDFDIALFKLSPREAAQTDPMQRLMLLTAYEALESSGYYDNGDEGNRPMYGTFYGVAGDDYRQVNSSQNIDTNYITGGIRAFGPGRVSYYFGWEGPSMSIDTACSASAVAIHQAISSLKLKQCDVALAGGANLLTCSDMFAGLSRAKFVCTTGPCKTFDETADGYCRADGFATVVLKRIGDAVREKDNILGLIRSVGTSHAGTAISLTHPEKDTQAALFRSVLSSAGVTMDEIDHIELHGTGTQAGDLAEAQSVVSMLDSPRPRDHPLTISSVKPNVGHSEAASGVTSLIKGLLMFQRKTIPRHVGIKTRLNPKLPLFGDMNVVIPFTNMPYPALSRDGTRRMLVNNFNATGGITAMLLEEYKTQSSRVGDKRDNYPIVLSAATPKALRRSMVRLLEYVQANPETNMSHLSYTLTARRLHHKHRFGCVAKSIDHLVQKLVLETSKAPYATVRRTEKPFTVFVFTGQTSILPQAKTLFDTCAIFRDSLHHFDQMCRGMDLPSFIEVFTTENQEFHSVQKQLALVALEIALASLFQSWGIYPNAVIGHSIGEYAALCICKVLSVADVLWLVAKRGLLLESKCVKHAFSMVVVALSAYETRTVLQNFIDCEISCLNAPQQTVVSGKDEDINALIAHLMSINVKATKVCLPYGFHSMQTATILDEYLKIVQRVSCKSPAIPFASTLLGKVLLDGTELNANYLCRQTREPVLFQHALERLEAFVGHEQRLLWVELGPSPACSAMIASTDRSKPDDIVAALDPKKPNWSTVSNVVTRLYVRHGAVRWDEYHKEHLDSLELLQLPSYPFDLERYWIQYDGDWMIRKNQRSLRETATAPHEPELLSSTLHCLESNIVEDGAQKLSFVTSLDKGMLPLETDDTSSVLPASVYADMAMAAACHLRKLSGESSSSTAMELSNMELPWNFTAGYLPTLQTTASYRPAANAKAINISIISRPAKSTEHARCEVVISGSGSGIDSDSWVSEAARNAYLYQSRIDLLQLFVASGQCMRLSGSDAYKFVVECDESQKEGIEEFVLNTHILEAVGNVRAIHCEGSYMYNPQWIGALIDVPTIMLNASRHIGYRCSGWSKMRMLMSLEANKTYRVHARMQSDDKSDAMKGDVHALDEAGQVVTVIKQLVLRPNQACPNGNSNCTLESVSMTTLHEPPSLYQTPTKKSLQYGMAAERSDGSASATTDASGHDMLGYTTHTPREADNIPVPPHATLTEWEGKSKENTARDKIDFTKLLGILAAEINVQPESLTDDMALEDLGVDSIIQISVIARLQECVAQPLSSNLLMKYNSVAKLRDYFTGTLLEQPT